jgi:hypothetical protein
MFLALKVYSIRKKNCATAKKLATFSQPVTASATHFF